MVQQQGIYNGRKLKKYYHFYTILLLSYNHLISLNFSNASPIKAETLIIKNQNSTAIQKSKTIYLPDKFDHINIKNGAIITAIA